MQEVLHANIFFFITGIAVIVFTALLCVALFHGIKVLQSIRRILARVEEEADELKEDLDQVREYFAQDGILRRLATKLFGKPETDATESAPNKKHTRRASALKVKDHE